MMLDYGFNYLNSIEYHRRGRMQQAAIRFGKTWVSREGKQVDGFFSQGKYSDLS